VNGQRRARMSTKEFSQVGDRLTPRTIPTAVVARFFE